ncbi:MAG: hypothetical protein IT435_03820 [Phycisphaerales bacterium]|nr:hypothetical protein [Phycisphaerales bacterium]
MEPPPTNSTRPRTPVRGIPSRIATLGIALLLGGCTSPWKTNYEGTRMSPLDAGTHVQLEPAEAIDITLAQSGDGWTLLGESSFSQTSSAGDDGLEAFARSIGATRVLWNVGEPITQAYSRTYHAPVTDTTRTTGTVTDASGRQRQVDFTSTTSRWEDRTAEGYEHLYPHAAAFFAPAR